MKIRLIKIAASEFNVENKKVYQLIGDFCFKSLMAE